MRFAAVVVAAVSVLASASRGAAVVAPPSASVTVSDAKAGARPVSLTLRLRYEMQCGNPGTGDVVVTFPRRFRLPSSLPAGAVLLNGKGAQGATLAAHTLTVVLPKRTGVLCDVIGPGVVAIELTRRADLGNPTVPGVYTLTARHAAAGFVARLRIR